MGFEVGIAEEAIEQAEHAASVLRLRKVAVIGLVTWPLFGLVDWFVVSFVQSGRLWYYLTLRAIGLFWLGLAAFRIYRRRMPSPGMLRFMDVSVFTALAVLISATSLEFQGIASPLAMGVMVVLICRAVVMAEPWRRSLMPVGLITGSYPVVLLWLSLLSPNMARQLGQPEAVASFALSVLFLLGAAAVAVAGGHAVWQVRRQVFVARSLGRYKLKQRIGQGANGEVWAAEHRTLGREVAVKIIRSGQGGPGNGVLARFEREVQATAVLAHPNTVRVFDFGVTEDGLCYFAMELLKGRDLGQILTREGQIAPGRAAHLVRQAALALAEAHACGIVHRDLKPSNLFVTSAAGLDELVKVLDFGLARVVRPDDPHLTREGWAVGTPSYISPEVLHGHPAEARSDIYALGAILYHLLCGAPPFQDADMYRVMAGHLNEEPAPVARRAGQPVPPGLADLVMRCLVKDPARRVPSAKALADGLRPFCSAAA